MNRPHLPPQPPLSNEQKLEADRYALFVQQTRQTLEAAGESVELRRWCVEKAIEASKGGYAAYEVREADNRPAHIQFACVTIARDIYDFVSEPIVAALANAKKDR